MARLHWRGGALLAPVPPALISCSTPDGKVNLVTVAWTGILSTIPPKTYISLRPSRHSYGIISETKEFVIHLCPSSMARTVDYCGMYTGKKVDKLRETGLHTTPSVTVGAPTITECPIALECRVTDCVPLGSHVMMIADITAVTVEDTLLDEKGALHLERADLLAYAHGNYYRLGDALGKFGFSAVKRQKRKSEGKAAPVEKRKESTQTKKEKHPYSGYYAIKKEKEEKKKESRAKSVRRNMSPSREKKK